MDRQLAELTQKFSNNVLDDTEAFVRVSYGLNRARRDPSQRC